MGNVIHLKNAVKVYGGHGDGLVVEVVTINPDTAAQWLKANRLNRPVRRRHVGFLAAEMERGHWQINGQAIVIAEDEQVLDGQHRLMAVIESGCTIETMVVYGISHEAFKTIDTGAVRTGGDAMSLEHPDAPRQSSQAVAGAVRWCQRMEKGFGGTQLKISNTDVLEYVQKHPSLWHCAEFLAGLPKDRPISLTCGVALLEIFSRKAPELAENFMRGFYTGEKLSLDDPEYILRQMLIRDAQRLTSYPMEVRMKMCCKAWNWKRSQRPRCTRQSITLNANDPPRMMIL